jgi:hypothetical protein
MPTKIPGIGSANWGTDLNNIFFDTTVGVDGSKPTPGQNYIGDKAMIDSISIHASDLTIYVDNASGNDSNSGFTPSAKLQTIKAAVEKANKIQSGGYFITIKITPGTYAMNSNADTVIINSRNRVVIERDGDSGVVKVVVSNSITAGSAAFQILSRALISDIQVEGSAPNNTANWADVANSPIVAFDVVNTVGNVKNISILNMKVGVRGAGACLFAIEGTASFENVETCVQAFSFPSTGIIATSSFTSTNCSIVLTSNGEININSPITASSTNGSNVLSADNGGKIISNPSVFNLNVTGTWSRVGYSSRSSLLSVHANIIDINTTGPSTAFLNFDNSTLLVVANTLNCTLTDPASSLFFNGGGYFVVRNESANTWTVSSAGLLINNALGQMVTLNLKSLIASQPGKSINGPIDLSASPDVNAGTFDALTFTWFKNYGS